MLAYYDTQVGIAWKWQALDGVITKAPLGGEDTGPSPVDRGKKGTKRSVLTDQRGAPLAVKVTGAHTPAQTVALATLDGIVVERPEKVVYRLHHLCLDKARASGIPEPSHVLRALGLTTAKSDASIRFSFGRFTSFEDIESAAYLVGEALATLSMENASRPKRPLNAP